MGTVTALEALKQRSSVNHFDPARTISDDEIRDLVTLATEAPSSYNMQHWRFIAVREKASKEKLKNLAFGQQKIADAAVTFIVLGDSKGYEKLADAFQPMIQKGAMEQKVLDGMIQSVTGFYGPNAQLQRDEAIRSGSLAAMNLMTAAQAKGLVSGPMIGFDPVGVKREFDIPEEYVPVMLVAVGYPAPGNWPKKPRFSVDRVLSFEKAKPWRSEPA